MAFLSPTFNRIQRAAARVGVGIAELELDKCCTDQSPNARIRLELIESVIGDFSDFGAIGKIENAQCVTVHFFGIDEQAGFRVHPHLACLPFVHDHLRFGQAAIGKRVNRGSDRPPRAFNDKFALRLKQLLDGGVCLLCCGRKGQCQTSKKSGDKAQHLDIRRQCTARARALREGCGAWFPTHRSFA